MGLTKVWIHDQSKLLGGEQEACYQPPYLRRKFEEMSFVEIDPPRRDEVQEVNADGGHNDGCRKGPAFFFISPRESSKNQEAGMRYIDWCQMRNRLPCQWRRGPVGIKNLRHCG